MSRSTRAAASSSATVTQQGLPILDRDVVMGPPPIPPQITPSPSAGARPKEGESQEVTEKYRRLKRKYFELEEKYKDTTVELQNSSKRAVQWRNERSLLLERIVELEAMAAPGQHPQSHGVAYPTSSAYPRALTNPTAQKRFHQNLERAVAEAEHEDPSIDPIFTSKHVGPNARRRMEAELKERMEEEAREARRIARRPRATRGKERAGDLPVREMSAGRMDSQRQLRSDGRDGSGPPLTLAPAPGSSHFHASEPTQQVVVSSSGTRLRIKPPAPPNQQSHYMDVDSPPPHDDSGSHSDLAHYDSHSSRDHGQGPARDSQTRPLVMSPPLGDPMAHSPMTTRMARHDPTSSLPTHPDIGRSERGARSPTPPPTLARSPVNLAYEHNGKLATSSDMLAHVSQSPSPRLPQPTSPVLSRSESSNTPPAAGATSPPQPAYSPNTKYRQVAPSAQALSSSGQSGPPTSGSQTPTSVASPPVGSGQPPVQVYALSQTPSAPNLSSMSVTAPKPIDPMGPNGPAAAMMHTFTPIMNPIPPPAIGTGYEQIPRNKPKRLKAHTVTTRSYSIPVVPRDKKGKPILPLNVGIMTVKNLGQICMREHFHTERYIFPVGYEVTRRYLSTIDPNADCVYHCTILDGGDGPKFQIIAADQPDKPIIAGTATGAWSVVVRAANHIRNRQHSNSVSGPDFFGLGQNSIKHLIQELQGADRLKDYVWQNFVEGGQIGGGRHQALLPAGPEDQEDPDAEDSKADLHRTAPLDEARELHIIQVPIPENAPAPPPMNSKPILFQQEYPDREPRRGEQGRGRRTSVHDPYERDTDDRTRSVHHTPSHSHHSHSHSHSHSASHSPAMSPRASHSPAMHRDRERDGYSPHASYHSPPAQQAVPAAFAGIMNAYSASPNGDARSSYESAPTNGSTRSRRSTGNGMDR